MGYELRKIKGREILDAIIKDGYGKIRGSWFEVNGDTVSACLLGAAGINLGVLATTEAEELEGDDLEDIFERIYAAGKNPENYTLLGQLGAIGHNIISIYDDVFSIEDKVDVAVGNLDGSIYETYDEEGNYDFDEDAWDALVKKITKETESLYADRERVSKYDDEVYTHTWDEAIEITKQLMEPVLDKEFELLVVDYASAFGLPNFKSGE